MESKIKKGLYTLTAMCYNVYENKKKVVEKMTEKIKEAKKIVELLAKDKHIDKLIIDTLEDAKGDCFTGECFYSKPEAVLYLGDKLYTCRGYDDTAETVFFKMFNGYGVKLNIHYTIFVNGNEYDKCYRTGLKSIAMDYAKYLRGLSGFKNDKVQVKQYYRFLIDKRTYNVIDRKQLVSDKKLCESCWVSE